nr:hypothetical protein [uncultured Fluviicola sp.]
MKNQKCGLLIAVVFLFFGMAQSMAQEKDPQTVIIRAFEFTSGKASHMTVTLPDGTINSIVLSVVNIGSFEGENENGKIIQSQINEWKRKGFEIEAFSTNTTYTGGTITTIILSKE